MQNIYTVFYHKDKDINNIAFVCNCRNLQTAINVGVQTVSKIYIHDKKDFLNKYKGSKGVSLNADIKFNDKIDEPIKNCIVCVKDKDNNYKEEKFFLTIIQNNFIEDVQSSDKLN